MSGKTKFVLAKTEYLLQQVADKLDIVITKLTDANTKLDTISAALAHPKYDIVKATYPDMTPPQVAE